MAVMDHNKGEDSRCTWCYRWWPCPTEEARWEIVSTLSSVDPIPTGNPDYDDGFASGYQSAAERFSTYEDGV